MTSKSDKLREVVEYAIEKGWNPFGDTFPEWQITSQYSIYCLRIVDKEVKVDDYLQFPTVLYDHDFGNAVFGEEDVYIEKYAIITEGEVEDYITIEQYEKEKPLDEHWRYYSPCYKWNNRGWKYHLQKAVISEDPIDYYHKFIKSHE